MKTIENNLLEVDKIYNFTPCPRKSLAHFITSGDIFLL